MKTSKEDVVGLLTALSEYIEVDHDKRIARYAERVDKMVEALSRQKTAKARKILPPYGHPRPLTIPRLELELKTQKAAQELVAGLKRNDPPILVWNIGNKVFVNPQCVAEGEDVAIVSRLKKLLH